MNNDYVLLKEHKQNFITESGIYLTPIKWNRYYDVVLSGNDDFNVGEQVLVEIGKGTDFEINGEKYVAYHINNIMAKLTK